MTAAAQSDAAGFPIRRGERRWTTAEITKIRTQLAAEAAELRDQADVGAKTYEREHELSLTYNARDLLVQTERALDRIESGIYGVCESCGKPIGKARLQAFPRATLCVSCKQREERR